MRGHHSAHVLDEFVGNGLVLQANLAAGEEELIDNEGDMKVF